MRFLRDGFSGASAAGPSVSSTLTFGSLGAFGLRRNESEISFFMSELFSGLSSATGSGSGSGSWSSSGSGSTSATG